MISEYTNAYQVDASDSKYSREFPHLFALEITHGIKGIDGAGGCPDFHNNTLGTLKRKDVDFPGPDFHVAIKYRETMMSKEFGSKVFPSGTQGSAIV